MYCKDKDGCELPNFLLPRAMCWDCSTAPSSPIARIERRVCALKTRITPSELHPNPLETDDSAFGRAKPSLLVLFSKGSNFVSEKLQDPLILGLFYICCLLIFF